MGETTLAVPVAIGFRAIGLLGDGFLKVASARADSLRTVW